MWRLLLLACLLLSLPPAYAAGPLTGPDADSVPIGAAKAAAALSPDQLAARAARCPARPPIAVGAPSRITVQLDPDTLWRPRGGEVRFFIKGTAGAAPTVTKVRVCFGWASPEDEPGALHGLFGSPQVRSIANRSGVTYGGVVPVLPGLGDGTFWLKRIFGSSNFVFTGGFTVPVADMVVEVTTADGATDTVVTATQVGVTSVAFAWVVVATTAILLWLGTRSLAQHLKIPGSNLFLRAISTSDGYASLSQMQMVLWTLVVALSAIYVITLSGNLINISQGTLVLLGIAGGAGLMSRATAPQADAGDAAPPDAAGPAAAPADPAPESLPDRPVTRIVPEWSDLLVASRDSGEIDVTRLQMLGFTLITAAFVAIKVVVDYEIPEIPDNFLILMGISNGLYIGGKKLPSLPKKAPG